MPWQVIKCSARIEKYHEHVFWSHWRELFIKCFAVIGFGCQKLICVWLCCTGQHIIWAHPRVLEPCIRKALSGVSSNFAKTSENRVTIIVNWHVFRGLISHGLLFASSYPRGKNILWAPMRTDRDAAEELCSEICHCPTSFSFRRLHSFRALRADHCELGTRRKKSLNWN